MHPVTLLLLLLAFACNLPLLTGNPAASLLFQVEPVLAGAWWRVFTHPFVHVGWYHLALDAGAFFLLWHTAAAGTSTRERIALLLGTGAGSLIAAIISGIPAGGFCGLSGMAHGLMAYQGMRLRMSDQATDQRLGSVLVLLVLGKSVLESYGGEVLFRATHLGEIGLPVAACHLGGAIGGVLVSFRSSRAS